MQEITNSFVFTEEGRRALVSQEGGVKFAVAGALLVQGLDVEDLTKLTYDGLVSDGSVIVGMQGISYDYITDSDGKVNVAEMSEEAYAAAFDNIYGHLYPAVYVPAGQMVSDSGACYGEYDLEFDRTSLAWNMPEGTSVKFEHVVLIGKQYAESSDAVFNVDLLQKPVIVGVAAIDDSIEFPADESEYVSFKVKLLFTVTDTDNDATQILCDTASEELLDMSDKLSVVNNGLRTDAVSIVDTNNMDETVAALDLNPNGSFMTRKSMMIADPLQSPNFVNDWNAGGLIHLVNKKDEDDTYKKQILLTSVEPPVDDGEITGYYAGISLNGRGAEISGTVDNIEYMNIEEYLLGM